MRLLTLTALLATLALPVSAATLTEEFNFASGYTNTAGGGTASGPGEVSGGRYNLDFNEGLRVNLGSALSTWSIVFRGELDVTTGYRKLVDFSNRLLDTGLYNLNGTYMYYSSAFPTAVTISTNTDFIAALTYDGLVAKGYLNGVQQFSFNSSGTGGYPGTISAFDMWADDIAVPNEAAGGSIDFVQVYEGALTGTEVAAITDEGGNMPAVPVPASAPLLLAGIAAFAALRRRKA